MPSWVFDAGVDTGRARLADPEVRARLKRELETGSPGWSNLVESSGGWENIVVVNTRAGEVYGKEGYVAAGCGMGYEATMYLLERGVRYVQLWHGKGQPWDNHDKIEQNHRKLAGEIDWDAIEDRTREFITGNHDQTFEGLGMVVHEKKGGADRVPFHQTVVLQTQLLS